MRGSTIKALTQVIIRKMKKGQNPWAMIATYVTLLFLQEIMKSRGGSTKELLDGKSKNSLERLLWMFCLHRGKALSAELNSEEEVVVPSIHTSNIEATLKRIKKFGGKILKTKTPVGKEAEFGCFAIFEDPNGNKMCLYSER